MTACRACGGPIDAALPTPYCSPRCAESPTAAEDHAHHEPPGPNTDGWIYCEPCGGWVVHRPVGSTA